jgi:hypothetical protein
MSAAGLALSLCEVGAILVLAGLGGFAVAGAFLPRGRAHFAERIGWGWAIGLLLIVLDVGLCFALGVRPGPLSVLLLFLVATLLARRFSLPLPPGETKGEGEASARLSPVSLVFLSLALLGTALYLLRALTEPMWSNDFLAIWGLKGKTLFGEVGIPTRLFDSPSFAFSHPEYPIGLPLLYSGVAFLLGRWEDHALALLFPFWLVATLFLLYGWLRRRGASRLLALATVALLSHFEQLYSAFLTGMAEVPISFAFVLVGTALSDALDRTDAGAVRRLALASLVASGTKNEGLFMVGTALALLAFSSWRRRTLRQNAAAAAALFGPALLCKSLHRLALGNHPLRDFDFGFLARPGLATRVWETLRAEAGLFRSPSWLVLFGFLALLLALGRRARHGDRLLVLAGASLGAYLILPVFCVQGPLWFVTWTTGRAVGALVPLVAAGAAARLAWLFSVEASSSASAALPEKK